MKKYQKLLSENFHFLVGKFSVYLNRRVFVMLIKRESVGMNGTSCTYMYMSTLIVSHGLQGKL